MSQRVCSISECAGVTRAVAYSPNPAFYEPMCHPCHVSSDVANVTRKVIAK